MENQAGRQQQPGLHPHKRVGDDVQFDWIDLSLFLFRRMHMLGIVGRRCTMIYANGKVTASARSDCTLNKIGFCDGIIISPCQPSSSTKKAIAPGIFPGCWAPTRPDLATGGRTPGTKWAIGRTTRYNHLSVLCTHMFECLA